MLKVKNRLYLVRHYPGKDLQATAKKTVEGQRVIMYLYWGETVLEVHTSGRSYCTYGNATVQLISLYPCSAEFILANHLSNYFHAPSLELPANFCRGLPVSFRVLCLVPAYIVSRIESSGLRDQYTPRPVHAVVHCRLV